jgi:hypothetical protein
MPVPVAHSKSHCRELLYRRVIYIIATAQVSASRLMDVSVAGGASHARFSGGRQEQSICLEGHRRPQKVLA